MIAIIDSSLIGIITNQHDDQLPVSLFTNNCKPVDKYFIIMQHMKVKSIFARDLVVLSLLCLVFGALDLG